MASCTNTSVRFQLRRATESQWAAANPVLLIGEPAYSSDTGQLKIGNGSSNWSALAYINIAGISGAAGGVGTPTTLQAIVYLTASNKVGTNITISPTAAPLVPGSAVSFTSNVTDTGASPKNIAAYIVYYVVTYNGTTTVQVSRNGFPNLVAY